MIGDFVGWNGGTHENKSSDRILEEALLLPKSEEIFSFAGYTEDHIKFEKAEVTFRTLGNSIGRCMFFSPPVIQAELHRLFVLFNNSYLDRRNLSTFEMKIFLMDSTHQTRISKSGHVEGDPLFDCAIYTKSNSFDKCVQKELKELFTFETNPF